MFKTLHYCFILVSTLSLNAQGFEGDSWADALNNNQATIVLTNVQSDIFSDAKTKSGICFDIMDDFADFVKSRYGVTVTYKFSPVVDTSNFKSFLQAVENSSGGVVGLGDITITPERRQVFDFSPPFFSNVAVLVTKKDVPQLDRFSDLPSTFNGMRAISQGGTTHDQRIQDLSKKYGNFPIVYAASAADKSILVSTSPKYFTYMDLPNYLNLVSQGASIKRHPVGDVSGEMYGFILPRGSDWTSVFQEFFAVNGGYLKSRAYQQVLSINLGSEVVSMLQTINSGG